MGINDEIIRNQIGPFISACNDIIDKIITESSSDLMTSKRVKAALRDIQEHFFRDPDNFKFVASVEKTLSKDSPDIYQDLQELVAILQGKSELYPLAGFKFDGEGRPYAGFTHEEQLALRSAICVGVATKINTTIIDIHRKRKVLAEVGNEVRDERRMDQASLRERAESVRARQALRSTQEGAIQLVNENGMELEYLGPFQDNKDVVLAAVKQNGRALQFVSTRLKNDIDVIKAALNHADADFIIQYTGEDFRSHRTQLLEAIRRDEMVIGYGNDELVEDRGFLLEAIDANPMVLQLILDESLRNDKEIAIRALKSMYDTNPDNLEFILQTLGDEIRPFAQAFKRIIENPLDFYNLEEGYRNDRDIILEVVRRHESILENIGEELRNDREFMLKAIKQNPKALQYASEALRSDRAFILEAVRRDGFALEYVGEFFRNDREVVLEAVRQNGAALRYVSESLRNNREFILAAVRINGTALEYASKVLKKDKEVVLEAVRQNGAALAHASKVLKNDKEVVLEAVRESSWVLMHASKALQKDPDVIAAAQIGR